MATAASAKLPAADRTRGRRPWFRLSPINARRLAIFRANKRGWWSFWIFIVLYGISLLAPILANDKPLLVLYKGGVYLPLLKVYPETAFGGDFETEARYRDPILREIIAEAGGRIVWPPIRYSYDTQIDEMPMPAPSPPSWLLDEGVRCNAFMQGVDDPSCTIWNWNWLGTDANARDVLSRVLYGFRLSVTFGLLLTFFSSIIGIVAGAVQGYFGGLTDLIFQRVIEIWAAIPTLYVLMILAKVLPQSFWTLLGILVLFGWIALVGFVRAEFLRVRNFEYVRAARALGVSDWNIIFKHLLPNALVATVTFVPFITSGAITSLTALDFLGLGMPTGSPSLGDLVAQSRDNLQAPWLGFTSFIVLSLMLSLLVFVGEAVRDAFDPRKTLT